MVFYCRLHKEAPLTCQAFTDGFRFLIFPAPYNTYSEKQHLIKGFADNITVISPSISAHSSVLKIIDQNASSLDLHLRQA